MRNKENSLIYNCIIKNIVSKNKFNPGGEKLVH